MPNHLLKFVSVEKAMPEKRGASARRSDFDEIFNEFEPRAASEQAGRCSQCGVPFCQVHCPLHNNIPDWLKLTAEGRYEEAYEMAASTNNFPDICGRICPQDRLCEGNCVIEQSGHGTVTIGAIEKFITDNAWANGWIKPLRPLHARNQSVGIIGAGPGGLAAAEQLRRKGYRVTVYDRYDRVGGLLIYGIPNFKLEKEIVARRAQLLADSGIEFRLNCEIGRDLSFADLRARHDAVLVATGVYQARDLAAPGSGSGGIVQAIDYLTASNRKGLGDRVPDFENGLLDARGRRVVVIGGGDTAMDCVRTAVRQGVALVSCLYRRDRQNMPGSLREVAHAEEEGIQFVWLAQPEAFVANGQRVAQVRAQRIHLGVPDATGRQVPRPIEGDSFALEADLVVKALGFDAEDLPQMFDTPGLDITRWRTLKVHHRSLMTSLDGVFAAGDIVRGASLVVWAVRDGRDSAQRIHKYLKAKSAPIAVAAE